MPRLRVVGWEARRYRSTASFAPPLSHWQGVTFIHKLLRNVLADKLNRIHEITLSLNLGNSYPITQLMGDL